MKMFRENGEVAYANEALGALEEKHSRAKEAYDAAQEGRVAVQEKQRELQLAAAGVHEELVRLRKALRKLLGSSHFDYQRLRIGKPRGGVEPPVEETPVTAETSAHGDRTSRASSVG